MEAKASWLPSVRAIVPNPSQLTKEIHLPTLTSDKLIQIIKYLSFQISASFVNMLSSCKSVPAVDLTEGWETC